MNLKGYVMPVITIDLNVEEAEEIMIGLRHRFSQKGNEARSYEIKELIRKIGSVVEGPLGADPGWAERIINKPPIVVTVKAI